MGLQATHRCGRYQLDPRLLSIIELINALLIIKLGQVVRLYTTKLLQGLAVDAIVAVSVMLIVGVGFNLERLAALGPPGQVKIVVKKVLRHVVVTLIARVDSFGARALQAHYDAKCLYL